MAWLLLATNKPNDLEDTDTTGHKWDGIEELNNPLPRWWLGLFIITIIFAVGYLYLYPGLGNFAGSKQWTQVGEFQQGLEANRQKQAEYLGELANLPIEELAQNSKAMDTAGRLFANNCSTCHGADARGAKGFPNLRDDDWLYGFSPDKLVETITNGRAGIMPNLALSDANVAVLSEYVRSLAGAEVSDHVMTAGPTRFMVCAACHGADGKGNQTLGAPNLTDDIWLHGSSSTEIQAILRNGLNGNMPSFSSLLGETEIKLLAAYVFSFHDETQVSSTVVTETSEVAAK
ncbi:UNVERIFIED_CONTAM: hypothetical protein GTU68_003740 [Idotea baltica]|nr:hypothetical protein [Idotea baltica]